LYQQNVGALNHLELLNHAQLLDLHLGCEHVIEGVGDRRSNVIGVANYTHLFLEDDQHLDRYRVPRTLSPQLLRDITNAVPWRQAR
jgi:hypothetical protein